MVRYSVTRLACRSASAWHGARENVEGRFPDSTEKQAAMVFGERGENKFPDGPTIQKSTTMMLYLPP